MILIPYPDGLDNLIAQLCKIAINKPVALNEYRKLIVSDIRGYPALPEKQVTGLIYSTLIRHHRLRGN